MAIWEELAAAGTPRANSVAVGDSLIVVTHQAVFYGFDGRNTDTTNGYYIMVFDSKTVPANGTVPIICVGVPAAGTTSSTTDIGNFGYTSDTSHGERFVNGIVICGSSTDANTGLTITSGSKLFFHVQYASEDGLSSS